MSRLCPLERTACGPRPLFPCCWSDRGCCVIRLVGDLGRRRRCLRWLSRLPTLVENFAGRLMTTLTRRSGVARAGAHRHKRVMALGCAIGQGSMAGLERRVTAALRLLHLAIGASSPVHAPVVIGSSSGSHTRALVHRVESPGRQEIAPDSKGGEYSCRSNPLDLSGICSNAYGGLPAAFASGRFLGPSDAARGALFTFRQAFP
jgi:hypothetical protein